MAAHRILFATMLLLMVFSLVYVPHASADTPAPASPPAPDPVTRILRALIGELEGGTAPGQGPAAAGNTTPAAAGTVAPADTPVVTTTPGPVAVADLENVDCSVSQSPEVIYQCRGNVRIRGGAYDEVVVVAAFPGNMTYVSAPVSMGGANITLRPFRVFPDTKFQHDEPSFFVRLDGRAYPVAMDRGDHGTAWTFLPPPATPAPAGVTAAGPAAVTSVVTAAATPAPDGGGASRSFPYVLAGTRGALPVTLSAGEYTGLTGLPPFYTCVRYNHDPTPCTEDEIGVYYRKFLNEPGEQSTLEALGGRIRAAAPDPDDQARIAISLVQEIPYDQTRALDLSSSGTGTRYPYETLYDNTGICSDKSLLLAALLRDLGYGVALFTFGPEKHMAVGIRCEDRYAYRGTGYCFIETTNPSIPTDSAGEYAGVGRLTSTPGVIVISDGVSYGGAAADAKDAAVFDEFTGGETLPPAQYRVWETLMWKYGMRTADGRTFTTNPAAQPLCGTGTYCNNQCYHACPAGATSRCESGGLVCYR